MPSEGNKIAMTNPGTMPQFQTATVDRLPTAPRAPGATVPLRSASSLRVVMGITPDYRVPEREKRGRAANIKHLVAQAAAEAGLDIARPIQEQFKKGNGEAAIKNISRVLGWDDDRSRFVALRTLTENPAPTKRPRSSAFNYADLGCPPKGAKLVQYNTQLPPELQDLTPSSIISSDDLDTGATAHTTRQTTYRIPPTAKPGPHLTSHPGSQLRPHAPEPQSQLVTAATRPPRTLHQQVEDSKTELMEAKSDAFDKQNEALKAQSRVAALEDKLRKLEYTLGLFTRPAA